MRWARDSMPSFVNIRLTWVFMVACDTARLSAISLFVRQILDELRKVVRPTGSELLNYTIVVILFVLTIMAIVAGLDFLFHRAVLWTFAGT